MIKAGKRLVHQLAPRPLVNFVWNAASDLKDLPARLRDPRPRPWRTIHNIGGGDFYAKGAGLFEQVRIVTGLKPSDHVLDIGCGAGRLAIPLCAYLDETGAYTGFDIAAPGLRFARRAVTCAGEARFVHADLANREYRRTGGEASGYRFPAADASIDVAVATSLFTHVEADVAAAYLREAGRVLKPGGRLFMTAFIVDAPAREALAAGSARLAMGPYGEGCWAADPRNPERAIGFGLERFSAWIEAAGLDFAAALAPGDWREPAPARRNYQDRIVLARV